MTLQRRARTRLAVDIGGTFTDLVLALPDRTLSAKLLTTHAAPDEAVIAGTQAILHEAGIEASSLDLVIHGTTLATNALIERKGARCALVTTAGFRNSLEIAYEHRFEQYDLYMERPEPLISRDLRLEVAERLAADGSVLLPFDATSLERLIPTLAATGHRGGGSQFPALLHQSRARGTGAGPDRAAVAACGRHDLVGGLPRDPRIRTNLDRGGERLRAADDGSLSRRHAGWIASDRRDLPVAADDVLGRHLHGRDRAALPGAAGGERPGRRRHPRASRRRAWRLRACDLVRHGRHDGEDHADRRLYAAAVATFRSRARLSIRQGQRISRAHPGDRHGGDRRRRRLDRACRSAATHRRGTRQRGCGSRVLPAMRAAATSRR